MLETILSLFDKQFWPKRPSANEAIDFLCSDLNMDREDTFFPNEKGAKLHWNVFSLERACLLCFKTDAFRDSGGYWITWCKGPWLKPYIGQVFFLICSLLLLFYTF